MSKLKILIADDHTIVRMGIVSLLKMNDDFEVVGEAKNGKVAVSEALAKRPDVVVMDLMMPIMDGIAATMAIKAKQPETHVVLLTTFSLSDGISEALAAGAEGAVFKSSADTELVTAIRRVATGKTYVSPDIKRLLASDPPIEALSPRQKEILKSITRGLSNTEIARQLGISPTVVRNHTTALFAKLGAANRTEAVAIALRKQLLKI